MVNKDIRFIKGIGEKRAEAYHRLGIDSPDALLRYYPKSYINPGKTTPVNELISGSVAAVRVVIDKRLNNARIKGGRRIIKFYAFDETERMSVVYFNNPYTPEKLIHGEEYILFGRVSRNLYGAEMTNPTVFSKDTADELMPIYPASAALSSRIIEKNIKTVLSEIEIEDPMPKAVLKENGLMSLSEAIHTIHSPKSISDVETAKERLVFDELFYFQLGLLKLKSTGKKSTIVRVKDDFSPEPFYRFLPFEPTSAQKRAVNEALNEMKSGIQMNRLLQGDVGSGKTLVAAVLMLSMVRSGYQAVLMAPTEILAAQHYKTMENFFSLAKINTVLLTGSKTAKEKREIKKQISSGEADIIIGTHALIEKDVEFANLGLVITDEQHRFGVSQRSALFGKENGVHCLVMSATPIPRTLALVLYSDLDVSVLDEIPKNRKPIETLKIDSSIRERALTFIKKNCEEGRNAYIVCPLIEEGPEGLLSLEEYLELLKNSPVKDIPFAVLHGRMKASEKDAVMSKFKNGEIKLLISTTVVEVGVDVPNANIMMIENAERFGLSQLHQLRGRVGRGEYKSYCILLSDSKGSAAAERLGALCDISDGFKIAEYDLKTRGPGDFFGNMQHGLPAFKIADMAGDMRIVKKATEAAAKLIKSDKNLEKDEHKKLRQEVNLLFKEKTEKIYL